MAGGVALLPSALGARVWGSGGLVWGGLGGLSHGPLYVVVEALAQLGVDCLLDCLAGPAVYHLWHGQSAHGLDRLAVVPALLVGQHDATAPGGQECVAAHG